MNNEEFLFKHLPIPETTVLQLCFKNGALQTIDDVSSWHIDPKTCSTFECLIVDTCSVDEYGSKVFTTYHILRSGIVAFSETKGKETFYYD